MHNGKIWKVFEVYLTFRSGEGTTNQPRLKGTPVTLQGVPADELPPGLEALHTVDEALMSRQLLLQRSQVSFVLCFLRRKHI